MCQSVRLVINKLVSAEELLSKIDALIAASSTEATLFIAEPTGEGVALGRFQRPSSVLRFDRIAQERVYRRSSGGKGTFLGEGLMYVGLILPSLHYLVHEPFSADRAVNRYIRPILNALESFRVKAFYYGTDYVILNKKRGGYVSFDVDDRGVVLIEVIIGNARGWTVPSEWRGYPPQTIERSQSDTTLQEEINRSLTLDEFADALTGQFIHRYGVDFSSTVQTLTLPGPAKNVSNSRFSGKSSLRETAIGFVEAGADVVEGKIERIKIYGDFIANSPAVTELEEQLQGLVPERQVVQEKVEKVFGLPGNFMIGLRPLSLITEVVLEAASNDVTRRRIR